MALSLGLAAPVCRADARQELQAAYDRLNAAIVRRDRKTVLAMHAPDYTVISAKGEKTGFKQFEEGLSQLFGMAKSIRSRTSVQKVAQKGAEATATVREHGEVEIVNPRNVKESATMVIDSTAESVWEKTARGWIHKRSREVSTKQAIRRNGAPAGKRKTGR